MRIVLFLSLVFIAGCDHLFQPEEDDPVIARANDKYLKESELAEKIPDGLSERDSLTLAQNYITKWIQQEILLQKANEMLSASEQDFSAQLQEYRNSLLMFSLEQKLVSQHLDTEVTEKEIEGYYEENRGQFELKANIVKFDFVKVPKKSRQLKDFRKLMKSADPDDITGLERFAEKNATDFWFAREWITMNYLLDEMPLTVDNQALWLRRTKYSEAEDSLYIYLLRINDFKTTDSIPPLEFERERIRNIIVNSRKLNLIEQKRQEFIEQAFRDNYVEIY
ncbi:MAG: hypothetical protein K0B08_03005 [Bacteroidales bacterium]|nr:hypothetical protein [Bacteroidales bacterium]